MIVKGGSTDVTTYFQMRLLTGGDATGLTISDFDMTYVRTRETGAAKVDAVALAAANTAHTDNRGIEVDATNAPGRYRFDWPDAAFAAGTEVVLTIKHTSCFTESLRVELVDYNPRDGVRLGLTALPNAAAEAAGGLYTRGSGAGQINQAANGQIDANVTHAAGTAWASGAITAAVIANGAIDAATFAADVDAEILSYLVDDATRIDASALNTATGTTIPTNLNATVSSRSSHSAADVWAVGTRVLTASTNLGDLDDAILAILGTPAGASLAADIAAIEAQTDDIGAAGAGLSAIPWNAAWDAEVQSEVADALAVYDPPTHAEVTTAVTALLTTQMTEAYAADGVAPTLAQALFLMQQKLGDFAISGTTLTVKKLDGTTTAATFTLNDATSPTALARAS